LQIILVKEGLLRNFLTFILRGKSYQEISSNMENCNIALYYLNLPPKSEGKGLLYEIHKEDCPWLEQVEHSELIGDFLNCREAINKAQLDHPDWKIEGCFYCSKDCHNL